MQKVSISITSEGLDHMAKMFDAEHKAAEREIAEIEGVLNLMERLSSNITIFVEGDYGIEKVTLSRLQSDVIVRALESRLAEESGRADRLAEAREECDSALNNAKGESK